jgi:hypothetical protein
MAPFPVSCFSLHWLRRPCWIRCDRGPWLSTDPQTTYSNNVLEICTSQFHGPERLPLLTEMSLDHSRVDFITTPAPSMGDKLLNVFPFAHKLCGGRPSNGKILLLLQNGTQCCFEKTVQIQNENLSPISVCLSAIYISASAPKARGLDISLYPALVSCKGKHIWPPRSNYWTWDCPKYGVPERSSIETDISRGSSSESSTKETHWNMRFLLWFTLQLCVHSVGC